MELPILIKKDAKGNEIEWKVIVEGDQVTMFNGRKEGKMIKHIQYGEEKNIGKKNYQTKEDNAINIAKSKWRKKIDAGYIAEDKIQSETVKSIYEEKQSLDVGADFPLKPMLVQQYKGKTIEDVYIQPKLDGFRCISSFIDGKVVLHTRGRKKIVVLQHIKDQLMNFFKYSEYNIHFDGELYSHSLTRQEISSFVKRKNIHERENEIEYHIYDVIFDKCSNSECDDSSNSKYNDKTIFSIRYKFLSKLFKEIPKSERKDIILVETNHFDEIDNETATELAKDYVDEGFEGIIIRKNMSYELGKRSSHILKVKPFNEMDVTIVDMYEASGDQQGCAIFVVRTDKGIEFPAIPTESLEVRRQMLQNRDLIGSKVSLRYYGETEKGIPQHVFNVIVREEFDIDE